jgi:FKBP-type peptidyl-prolyl cis-trans isomerase SlyD
LKKITKEFFMQVEEKKVVSIHYKLTDDDGKVLDSSENDQPLVFIYGIGMLIPGLEKALEGKVTGDKLKVSVNPEEAYGERDEGLTQMVPKSQFDEEETLQLGMQFQVETEQGVLVVTVIEVTDTEVKIDGNHPLAGMKLHFDVSVGEIREATDEEIDHGHVHGAGGHDH